MGKRKLSPVAISVIIALSIMGAVMLLGGSVAGSYVLLVHYVNTLNAQQHVAQAQNSMKLCRSILQMDQARLGATFTSGSSATYGHKLSLAIHQLYVNSNCPSLLKRK